MSILDKIIAQKELEVSILYEDQTTFVPEKSFRSFLEAISKPKNQRLPNFIMEIKKSSPSKGEIAPNANILNISRIYEESGAAAISVLTDQKFFGGSLEDLSMIAKSRNVPILRKDFIIDSLQILEARKNGADAILLMTSVVKTAQKLKSLRKYAENFGMDVLVETQDENEIAIALESGAKIIGVNARSFSDLSVDVNRFAILLQKLPNHIVRVAESGIKSAQDVQLVAPYCDAVLIGSALMETRETEIETKIKLLQNET